ncbi:phage protein Gp13 family protein [Rhizobium sp. IMFF44]|uniref:phage protein Gp13 family protein n=1 Tax=Rhizobium sp. IMFF44 TaxID=3342350 RepID=UPI0035B7CE8A
MLETRPSQPEDVTYLAPRLREADRQELLAAGSPSPEQSLTDGLMLSKQCISIVDEEDRAVAMFGVCPSSEEGVGFVWLLGSDEIKRDKTKFLRRSKQWVDIFHEEFAVLTNFVDRRNEVHLKWLRWLGFKFLRIVNAPGPGNLPFYEFARIRNV